VAGAGEASWDDFAREAASRAGFDPVLVETRRLNGYSAPRPEYSALGSERAVLLPSWQQALGRFLREREIASSDGIEFATIEQ
jgi:dTDP-4-dehydrorhamnose reductase